MTLFQFSQSAPFRPDSLSWVMAGLILFVIANVLAYSRRYLAGDRNQGGFSFQVMLLGAYVMIMAFADHLLIFLTAWAASNLLLVRLMIHKGKWVAARNSGLLALKTFGIGFLFLATGFWLLAESSGTPFISGIDLTAESQSPLAFVGLLFVLIAAMTQSATWPFHGWLTSSLNSPTPVSALMHAGLVNGGGFLLVRFAPLFVNQPALLHLVFLVGLITAVIGAFWKLLQTDIKRMLACSTMGQMGFMLMQCGMGLFAPAVSHLCWHGLFKAYLFLSAGSVVQEKRTSGLVNHLTPVRIVLASLSGVAGAWVFALTSGTELTLANTESMMIGLAFMAGTQLAFGLLNEPLTAIRVICAPVAGMAAGLLYGFSIRVIETTLTSLHATQPQPLDGIYLAGFAVIFLSWIAMIVNLPARLESSASWKRLYVAALNASQPKPQTITATRTSYQS